MRDGAVCKETLVVLEVLLMSSRDRSLAGTAQHIESGESTGWVSVYQRLKQWGEAAGYGSLEESCVF